MDNKPKDRSAAGSNPSPTDESEQHVQNNCLRSFKPADSAIISSAKWYNSLWRLHIASYSFSEIVLLRWHMWLGWVGRWANAADSEKSPFRPLWQSWLRLRRPNAHVLPPVLKRAIKRSLLQGNRKVNSACPHRWSLTLNLIESKYVLLHLTDGSDSERRALATWANDSALRLLISDEVTLPEATVVCRYDTKLLFHGVCASWASPSQERTNDDKHVQELDRSVTLWTRHEL